MKIELLIGVIKNTEVSICIFMIKKIKIEILVSIFVACIGDALNIWDGPRLLRCFGHRPFGVSSNILQDMAEKKKILQDMLDILLSSFNTVILFVPI